MVAMSKYHLPIHAKPRVRSKGVMRPRVWRHRCPVEIGSDIWWRQARRLNIRRVEVEAALDQTASSREEWQAIDPHALYPPERPAERAAAYLLLATYVPTYATFMYVAHEWDKANRSLKEWITCQYASLVGDSATREAALYSLWVDFFEVPDRAKFMFPRLLKMLPRQQWPELLGASGPVPWEAKRSAYQAAAGDPSLHAGLARGLAGSFYDVYGSVEPVEARDLFRSIVVDDESLRAALDRITAQPTRWQLVAVVDVDETDERWCKWLPRRGRADRSFLLFLRALDSFHHWVYGSELVHHGRRIARLVHHSFPFDRAILHKIEGSLDDQGQGYSVLFRAEGDPAAARSAVGDIVEAWPPGLYASLQSSGDRAV